MASYKTRLLTVAGFILVVLTIKASGKIYDRCELARELRDIHEIPDKQIATWVCLARYESEFNTSATNYDSGDHGIFQISQLFWCSPPGYACGISCNDLKDDNLEDDVICARRIYREHRRLSGDGFNAWVVYNLYCKDKMHVDSFIEGCFDDNNLLRLKEEVTEKQLPRLSVIDYYPHIIKPSTPEKDIPKLPTIDYYPHIIKPTTQSITIKDLPKRPTIDYYAHIIKPTTKATKIEYYPHIIGASTEKQLPKKETINYSPHITTKSTTNAYNSLKNELSTYKPYKTHFLNQLSTTFKFNIFETSTKTYEPQTTKNAYTFKPYSFKTSTNQFTTKTLSTRKPYTTNSFITTTSKPFNFKPSIYSTSKATTTNKPFSFKSILSTTTKYFQTSTTKPFSYDPFTKAAFKVTSKKEYSFKPVASTTTISPDFTTRNIFYSKPSKGTHRLVGNKNDYAFSMSSNGFQLFKTDTL